jgi:hypothetical protein
MAGALIEHRTLNQPDLQKLADFECSGVSYALLVIGVVGLLGGKNCALEAAVHIHAT